MDKWDFIKSFCTPKYTEKISHWEKIFSNHLHDKGYISRIYKNSYNSILKQITQKNTSGFQTWKTLEFLILIFPIFHSVDIFPINRNISEKYWTVVVKLFHLYVKLANNSNSYKHKLKLKDAKKLGVKVS